MRFTALDDAATAAASVHIGTVDHVLAVLGQAVRIGTEFKRSETVFNRRSAPEELRDRLLSDLSANGTPLEQLLEEFSDAVLPWCKNESSPRFMGFADTGDDLAALTGEILSVLTQQNMINQGFDAPTATFVEIAVLRWLRDLLGYPNPAPEEVESVWDVGGIVTTGGTMSNTVAMMLARENHAPGTMHGGVTDPERFTILVPAGIGHYSVKSALTWIGVGAQLVEVATQGFRYDLGALRDALRARPGRVMAVVAYAGDSRTQTVDHLAAVHDVVREEDPTIWLHADACWGLLAAFNDRLTSLLEGIADFDSITVDPHKVMAVPYSLSALLVRQPEALRSISSFSDLIMQEDFAFGQVTPFVGSRSWSSLKLWMMMRNHGRNGLALMVEERLNVRDMFIDLIDGHPRLLRLHDPDLLAVAFIYVPRNIPLGTASAADIKTVNSLNDAIHARLLASGEWYLHHFDLPDDTGQISRGAVLRPLRFVAGNPRATQEHLRGALNSIVNLGHLIEEFS